MARRIVDETHLNRIRLRRRSPGQLVVAWLFLFPNYNLPPRTRIHIEGLEHLPEQRVIFALNHTDRYNYWPFQYRLYRLGHPFTTTWVKAKYYNHPAMAWFFDRCNNIPLPSLGYLIIQNVIHVVGRKPSDDEYRALRDWVESDDADVATADDIRERFPELSVLLDTPWRDYDPARESWHIWMNRWNDRVMGLVEQRTLEALTERDNNVIVFPQGTRSIRLLPAKPGLAEFALRHRIPVVPVGSMGSEHVYPGARPWANGGDILYRIGRPMTVDDRLAPYRIDEPYRPFTREADRFREQIIGASAEITQAIDEVLDPPYQLAAEDTDTRSRADRLA